MTALEPRLAIAGDGAAGADRVLSRAPRGIAARGASRAARAATVFRGLVQRITNAVDLARAGLARRLVEALAGLVGAARLAAVVAAVQRTVLARAHVAIIGR